MSPVRPNELLHSGQTNQGKLSAGSLCPLTSTGQSPFIKVVYYSSALPSITSVFSRKMAGKPKALWVTPTREQSWRSAFASWHSMQNSSIISSCSNSDLVPGIQVQHKQIWGGAEAASAMESLVTRWTAETWEWWMLQRNGHEGKRTQNRGGWDHKGYSGDYNEEK